MMLTTVFGQKGQTQRFVWLALVLALMWGLFLLLLPTAQAAQGATEITVTTTDDELNHDGDCSLREAIQAANTDLAVDACPAGNGHDTIMLPAGTYTHTLAGFEDENLAGDLDIKGAIH